MQTAAKGDRARLPTALVRASYTWPRLTFASWGVVLLLLTPGLFNLSVDTSADSVLDRSDEAWSFYQKSQDLFGGDEILVVALPSTAPFEWKSLRAVEELSEAAVDLPGIRRVDSIATVPVIHSREDGTLEMEPSLLPGMGPAEVTARLRRDRVAPRSLVSSDGRTLAINLVLDRNVERLHEDLVAQVRALAAPLGGAVSGVPVFRVETNGRTRSEILFFAPFTGLALLVVLWFIFRSVAVAFICLLPGVVGAAAMLAAMGILRSPLTLTTIILPSVVLALGSAYAMHLLVPARAVGVESIDSAISPAALPVALSGLTTVVGFGAIGLVRIDAVRFVGGFGGLGVLVVTAAALTLVPACLRYLSPPSRRPFGSRWLTTEVPRMLGKVAGARASIGVWLLIIPLIAAGVSAIRIETDATQWLPPGNPVRDDYDRIRELLSGISPLNFLITATSGTSVSAQEPLAAIDALARHLEERDDVGKVLSIADPLRQLHGGFVGDPAQPLPGTDDLVEQYLLVLGSLERMSDLISADRKHANILIRANNNGSHHLREIADDADRWWQQNGPAGFEGQTTGIMFEYARAEDEIAIGQLRGLAFALVAIGAILLAIFQWPTLALVSLVPNVLPVASVFGAMGALGIPLDAGTVLVGSLALGIAVDDTIHVVAGFVVRAEHGAPPREAVQAALAHALPAIVYSTVVLSLSFLILGLSEFTFTRNLGLLTAGILVLCLVADATILPALLVRLRPRGASQAK